MMFGNRDLVALSSEGEAGQTLDGAACSSDESLLFDLAELRDEGWPLKISWDALRSAARRQAILDLAVLGHIQIVVIHVILQALSVRSMVSIHDADARSYGLILLTALSITFPKGDSTLEDVLGQ
eukprot:CAMPEP_0170498704 /NCGR_PEP_ID=MMETSP0208-20121228/28667_1 /TAXON_ID=197538 /ORGANISM="Strombidium inclinatum, Strain S3" /LENGTH=124 /DNA_ID=CAMNT_0010775961 /DNA_START=296 /DNA_END=670 /DNA_ORIENTATION=-